METTKNASSQIPLIAPPIPLKASAEDQEMALILGGLRYTTGDEVGNAAPSDNHCKDQMPTIISSANKVQLTMPEEFSRRRPRRTINSVTRAISSRTAKSHDAGLDSGAEDEDEQEDEDLDDDSEEELSTKRKLKRATAAPKAPKKPKIVVTDQPVISYPRRIKIIAENCVCTNPSCRATESPAWRFLDEDVEHKNPLCNACRLYYKSHQTFRTVDMCNKPKKVFRLRDIPKNERMCVNCGETKSTWRFVDDKLYCNPCGQHRKRHGRDRTMIAKTQQRILPPLLRNVDSDSEHFKSFGMPSTPVSSPMIVPQLFASDANVVGASHAQLFQDTGNIADENLILYATPALPSSSSTSSNAGMIASYLQNADHISQKRIVHSAVNLPVNSIADGQVRFIQEKQTSKFCSTKFQDALQSLDGFQ